MPDDEIPFFRTTCREVLTPEEFRVVDRVYRRSYDSTSRWIARQPRIDEAVVGAHLAERIQVPSVHEQLTRLRGAQVAFLRKSWLLKADPEALSAAHSLGPPS